MNFKNKFNNFEIKYKEKFNQLIKESPVEIEGRIEKLLNEGNQFLNENNLNNAEQKFTEVISFDPRNLVALKSLFKIYLTQSKLPEAKKMGEYILQINKQSLKWWLKFNKAKANAPENLISELFLSLINLGDIYFKLGKKDEAIKYYKMALAYHPSNPRILDFLIENSIILEKKDEAASYLMRIKESNPENQKITEWEEKIKNMPNN